MQAILNYIFVFLASILHGKTSLSVHKIAAWNRISKRPIERSLRKKYLFSKWANPGLFSFIFVLFQANNTIFTTNKYEKISSSSSIWWLDSNPWPPGHKSSPITTRPGLPPRNNMFCVAKMFFLEKKFFLWSFHASSNMDNHASRVTRSLSKMLPIS